LFTFLDKKIKYVYLVSWEGRLFAQAANKFLGYFSNFSPLGFAIAAGFGIFWLLLYWPPLFKQLDLWLVLLAGAILTAFAAGFIQYPLTELAASLLRKLWSGLPQQNRTLLLGSFTVLISGLVQEGAKLLPVIGLRLKRKRTLDPLDGLLAGAAAGIGFGILETQWVVSRLTASGWSWSSLQTGGFFGYLSIWERLLAIGLHAGSAALTGSALARGRAWQGWLLAAFVHALAGFSAYLLTGGVLSVLVIEIYLTAVVAVLTVILLSFRWEKKI
jgi:RsiW-degrading membrane proteinase PrsW (M82 family)